MISTKPSERPWLRATACRGIGVILALLASTTVTLATAEAPKPNVLMICVDDLRPLAGCYGHPVIQTPNIDRLARRGTVFLRAYCHRAVCNPSRQSLLTGLRPDSIRVYDLGARFRDTRPQAVTLPEHFKRHGYHTVSLGKVFHRRTNDPRSWSEPAWWADYPYHEYVEPRSLAAVQRAQARLRAEGRPFDPGLWDNVVTVWGKKRRSWQAPDVPDRLLAEGKIAGKAIETLRRVRDKPFFLAVGFLKPHLPFVAPRRYFDLYPKEKLKLPTNETRPEGAPAVASVNSRELRGFSDIPDQAPIAKEEALELVRGYYACVSYVDAQIGRLLDELACLDLDGRTVVVLWGDHGFHLGENGQWAKDTNFEAALRAPLILAAPDQSNPGSRTAALVEFVDVYPTLCELAGLPLPGDLEGISLVPLMRRPDRPWKTAAFSQAVRGIHPFGTFDEITSIGHSIRTDRYRYTEWAKPGAKPSARELYDYQEDPGETRNLASEEDYEPLVGQLRRRLHAGWPAALPESED